MGSTTNSAPLSLEDNVEQNEIVNNDASETPTSEQELTDTKES